MEAARRERKRRSWLKVAPIRHGHVPAKHGHFPINMTALPRAFNQVEATRGAASPVRSTDDPAIARRAADASARQAMGLALAAWYRRAQRRRVRRLAAVTRVQARVRGYLVRREGA